MQCGLWLKILWVSWAAKKTNEWVLNKAGVKRELYKHCQSKEASIGHTVQSLTESEQCFRILTEIYITEAVL